MPKFKKGKRRYTRKRTGKTLVTRVKKLEKAQRAVVARINKKFLIGTAAGTYNDAAAGGTASAIMTNIAQGATDTTRVGDEVRLTRVRFHASYLGNLLAANGQARVVIFWDKQPLPGTVVGPTWGSVFQAGTAANLFFAQQNQPNRPRYKIIYDKMLRGPDVYASTMGVGAQSQGCFKTDFSWSNSDAPVLKYTGPGATDYIGPHLYYFIVTDATVNFPGVRVEFLLNFEE